MLEEEVNGLYITKSAIANTTKPSYISNRNSEIGNTMLLWHRRIARIHTKRIFEGKSPTEGFNVHDGIELHND